MSTRGASGRPNDDRTAMRTMQQDSPCFEKKITHSMLLRKQDRVEIPVSFTRVYSHLLDTVVSMTGPNGVTFSVTMMESLGSDRRRGMIRRYYLCHGWFEFAKENGIQTGDCVTFRLKRIACFHVHVSSRLAVIKTHHLSRQSGRKFISKPPQKKLQEFAVSRFREFICNKPLQQNLREFAVKGELGNHDGYRTKPQTEVTAHEETIEREYNKKASMRSRRGVVPEKPKDVSVVKCRSLRRIDYVKHPGLDAAISSNSKFPQFMRKLSGLSCDIRLELPYQFAKEYGHRFQALVRLRGPSGRWSSVKLGVVVSIKNQVRVQSQQGWAAFSLENEFKEGDVLLFSLVAFSKFVVQVFPQIT